MVRTGVVVAGLLFLFIAVGLRAEVIEDYSQGKLETGAMRLEVGGTVGYPNGVGAQIGVWNIAKTPIFARGGIGYYGAGMNYEAEVGALLIKKASIKQYIALVGGINHMSYLIGEQRTAYIGPQYGVILWNTLSVSAGVAHFSMDRHTQFLSLARTQHYDIQPFGKISASFFF